MFNGVVTSETHILPLFRQKKREKDQPKLGIVKTDQCLVMPYVAHADLTLPHVKVGYLSFETNKRLQPATEKTTSD